MVTTAVTPAPAAARRNQRLRGMSRWISHANAYQSDNRLSSVPKPTITSHDKWTVFTCEVDGASAAGSESSPCTTVLVPVFGSESNDANPGIGIPPLTVP